MEPPGGFEPPTSSFEGITHESGETYQGGALPG